MIHPERLVRELFDVNVGGTALVLDRARPLGMGRLVHVSSNSPFGVNPHADHRFDEQSPYHPYLGYGASKQEAEELVLAAADAGRRRRRDRAAAVVLRTPPAGPADAVAPGRAPRPVPAGGGRRPTAARWCSPATSCTGSSGPRRAGAPAPPTGSPTPSPTRWWRSWPRCGAPSRRRGSRCRAGSRGCRGSPGWWPRSSTAPSRPRPLRAVPPRARRAQGDDRLRHLARPGRRSATSPPPTSSRACAPASGGACERGHDL